MKLYFSFYIFYFALDKFKVITLKQQLRKKQLRTRKRSKMIIFCLVKSNFPLRHLQSDSFGSICLKHLLGSKCEKCILAIFSENVIFKIHLTLNDKSWSSLNSTLCNIIKKSWWRPLCPCHLPSFGRCQDAQGWKLLNWCWKFLTALQIAYTEEFEQQRGKGSFPAMITPGYCLAKKAQENASDVSVRRKDGRATKVSWHL